MCQPEFVYLFLSSEEENREKKPLDLVFITTGHEGLLYAVHQESKLDSGEALASYIIGEETSGAHIYLND